MLSEKIERMIKEARADMRADAPTELIETVLTAINSAKVRGKSDKLHQDERIAKAVLDVFNYDAPTEVLLSIRKRLRHSRQTTMFNE